MHIRTSISSSIHEAFLLYDDEEDTTKLRECLKLLLEENEKAIIVALNENLHISVDRYCNNHAVKMLKLHSHNGSNS